MNMSVIVKMMSIIMCMNVYKWLCYSQDDVNYYVHACLYMCEGVAMIMSICVVLCEGVRMIIHWLTTHFDKVNHVDRGSLNCWKISKKEYTRSSCDR